MPVPADFVLVDEGVQEEGGELRRVRIPVVPAVGGPRTLDLRFVLERGALTIEGAGPADGAHDRDEETTEFAALLLAALVDEHDISRDGAQVRFRLVKHQTGG